MGNVQVVRQLHRSLDPGSAQVEQSAPIREGVSILHTIGSTNHRVASWETRVWCSCSLPQSGKKNPRRKLPHRFAVGVLAVVTEEQCGSGCFLETIVSSQML